MLRRFCPSVLVALALLFPCMLDAQLQTLGKIIGQIRVTRSDFPSHQILVELRLRSATIDSAYTDAEGRFGFYNLLGGEYHVVINDEAYYPVDERAFVNPDVSPYTMVQISLRPREDIKRDDPLGARAAGANPYLVHPADYNRHFPRKALKEYEQGLEAEHKGKPDAAITHYLGALKIAPDYYPAHNNLGSLYLSKADFNSAKWEFQQAMQLDPNDAQAYFNLGNVLMLTGRYAESESAVTSGLQRRPDSAFGHFLKGCLSGRAGNYAEAEKSLREALRLDSTMWQAHLQLVNFYVQQGRRDNAISQLQLFVKAFPSAAAAPKARELLRKLQSSDSLAKP